MCFHSQAFVMGSYGFERRDQYLEILDLGPMDYRYTYKCFNWIHIILYELYDALELYLIINSSWSLEKLI